MKLIDKVERTDGTFPRSDFAFDPESNLYVCPGGEELRKYHRAFSNPTGVQSRTPSWANERHVIAVPDREGLG